MTTIAIVILTTCLVWCWYIILKKQERIEENFKTETRLEAELLRETSKVDSLKRKNLDLSRREDELIKMWADANCEGYKGSNKIISGCSYPIGHNMLYVVYEIDGIKIKEHIGTASETWEICKSGKKIYTKRQEAEAELKRQVEAALKYEEDTEDSLEVE